MLVRIKYFSPSGWQGSHLRAVPTNTDFIPVTIPYPVEIGGTDVYREALKAICEKNNWPTEDWAGDSLSGDEFIFIKQFDPYTRFSILLSPKDGDGQDTPLTWWYSRTADGIFSALETDTNNAVIKVLVTLPTGDKTEYTEQGFENHYK